MKTLNLVKDLNLTKKEAKKLISTLHKYEMNKQEFIHSLLLSFLYQDKEMNKDTKRAVEDAQNCKNLISLSRY